MDFLNLTQEQMEKIRECGRNMVPPSEVPFIIGCDEFLFSESLRTQGSEVRKAYMEGFTTTSFEVHKVTREIAEAGSPTTIADIMRSHSICVNEMGD